MVCCAASINDYGIHVKIDLDFFFKQPNFLMYNVHYNYPLCRANLVMRSLIMGFEDNN